jgi:hypothetical protein
MNVIRPALLCLSDSLLVCFFAPFCELGLPVGQIPQMVLGCLLSPRFGVGFGALFGSMALHFLILGYFLGIAFDFFFSAFGVYLFAADSLFCHMRRSSFDSKGRGGDGDGEEAPMGPHVVLPGIVKSIPTTTESSESSLHAIAYKLKNRQYNRIHLTALILYLFPCKFWFYWDVCTCLLL